MKPLKLFMNSFGAYADAQLIDFTLLGDRNFFLIHGPTGSGKTTILDAITFALYGTASGDLRETKNLRSDYAPPSSKTQVDFSFRSGAKEYLVVRTPEQEAAKARGTGTRKLPATAALYELDGGDEKNLLATGVSEVTKQVETIIGFKAEQFRQIVLLPQGEFRRFLVEDSKNRKTILETLFKTGIYRQIEQLLYDKGKQIERDYENLKKERGFLLESAGCEDRQGLLAKKETLAAERDDLALELQNAKAKLARATAEHQAAKALAAAFLEAQLAQDADRLLRQQTPLIAEKRKIAELAERAAAIEPFHDACQKDWQRVSQAREQLETTVRTLSAAKEKDDSLRQTLAKLLPPESEPFEGLQKLLSDSAAALHEAKNLLSLYEKLDKIEERSTILQDSLAKAREELKQTEKAEKAARDLLKNLQAAQIRMLANYLAAELRPGEPCPVCGSASHPRPAAKSEEEAVDLEAAEVSLSKASRKMVQAASHVASLESELDVQTRQQLTLQQEAGESDLPARQELTNFIAVQKAREEELRLLQRASSQAGADLSGALAAAASAENYAREAQASFEETKKDYKTQLDINGFAEQADYLAARKSPRERASLKQEISSFEQQSVSCRDRLVRALAAIDGKESPCLEQFAKGEEEAAANHEQLSNRLAVLAGELERSTLLLAKLKELESRGQVLEAAYRNTSSLSLTARGDNKNRLSFSAFVLQAILDDVLQSANLRLAQMSRGRYCLSRLDEVIDARRENGLNIEVMDSFTGVSRPVKTLSGGEIFLASLSLALGLSDIVQSYAGGIKLDTILVDEGFGSLDPEALDTAIKTLIDLQKSGRLVGIISHVAELKERIGTRLEITPGNRGSTAAFKI